MYQHLQFPGISHYATHVVINFTHSFGSCVPSHSTTCSTERLVNGLPDSCHCPSMFSTVLKRNMIGGQPVVQCAIDNCYALFKSYI